MPALTGPNYETHAVCVHCLGKPGFTNILYVGYAKLLYKCLPPLFMGLTKINFGRVPKRFEIKMN